MKPLSERMRELLHPSDEDIGQWSSEVEALEKELAALRAEKPAEVSAELCKETLYDLIRAFGYTTARQTEEIVTAIIDATIAAGKEKDHDE